MERKTILTVIVFSIAMAALESSVVVYLRALYYPGGFTVAFKLINPHLVLVELVREIATIVMLVCIGYFCGKTFKDRLAWFLFSFGVWDIFYYVWLKVFIGWPTSIFEWDILFLIPWTWLGPVLAPIICSVTMMVLAYALLVHNDRKISTTIWLRLLTGTIIILYTFLADYGSIIIGGGFLSDYANLLANTKFIETASQYLPERFRWDVFLMGEVFYVWAIASMLKKSVMGRMSVLGS